MCSFFFFMKKATSSLKIVFLQTVSKFSKANEAIVSYFDFYLKYHRAYKPDNNTYTLSKRWNVQIRNKEIDVGILESRVAAITRTFCTCSSRKGGNPQREKPIVEGMIKRGEKVDRVRQDENSYRTGIREEGRERKEKWDEIWKIKGYRGS